MNDFQNIGILLQLAAMIILLLKIVLTLDCTGISGRAQLLCALVFTTRFLDLPYEFSVSLPSFIMKIIYLLVAYLTVACIFIVCRKTYEGEHDTFRIEFLIGACTMMALLSTYKKWDIITILWYFSLYLEAFSILPQIHFTARVKYVGSSMIFYIGLLACYRAFYIVHWIYLFSTEHRIDNYYVAVGGTVQFAIYCVYFVWMVPIFKAQYVNLRNVESQSDILGVVSVQVNGVDDNLKKNEYLTTD